MLSSGAIVIIWHEMFFSFFLMFGDRMPLFLFIFCLYNIQYRHSFNHIHTIHLSVAIRRVLSPSPHLCVSSVGKTLPAGPSRESNSGLGYSKPTRYQLSHAAPSCYHLGWKTIIWDALLSSGANVIIWDEMLSYGMQCYHLGWNVIIWDKILSSGMKFYHLELMLSSGTICYHLG